MEQTHPIYGYSQQRYTQKYPMKFQEPYKGDMIQMSHPNYYAIQGQNLPYPIHPNSYMPERFHPAYVPLPPVIYR